MHEVLVNRLGGLSLPRKSVVRLTDRPDMTLDVYCGRKTTIQPNPTIIQISRTPRHQKLPIAQLQRPQHWNSYCRTHTYYGRTIASQLAMTREIIQNNHHHPTAARSRLLPYQHNLPTRTPLARRGKIIIKDALRKK